MLTLARRWVAFLATVAYGSAFVSLSFKVTAAMARHRLLLALLALTVLILACLPLHLPRTMRRPTLGTMVTATILCALTLLQYWAFKDNGWVDIGWLDTTIELNLLGLPFLVYHGFRTALQGTYLVPQTGPQT